MGNYAGCSYTKRVIEVNAIYDKYARSGLSNREIWRRYIYPIYAISEKTLYNYIKAAANITTLPANLSNSGNPSTKH